ncbi:DMT family transporter [Humibacter ginsenosidimutans]|uniref:DMT family transporter n=1 Tax=Humibacter ginsenosidimutans TaxID=2599293 RepID=A0A5B8M4W4_9MICO|nr:DMT family transporter [Humibacter ginsenosidimutans]QDZ14610.1 DMT family transporter [Humibacter ginsenosidimutans]
MLASIVLALISALSYGFSDFFAGRAAGRNGVVRTTLVVYLAATAAVALSLLFVAGRWSPTGMLWGGIAGVLAIGGFLGFYAAMAAGPMSLVSPLISVLESVVPVAVAIAFGERLPVLAWIAIGVAVVSTVVISMHGSENHVRISARTVVICVLTGVALGGSIVAFDLTPADSGTTPALVELLVGLVLLLAVVGIARVSGAVRRTLAALDTEESHSDGISGHSALWMTVGGGILLGAANAMLALAMHWGALAVVSVIVGVYPLATIVLARVVLKERMSAVQLGGVALALAAIAVLAVTTGG